MLWLESPRIKRHNTASDVPLFLGACTRYTSDIDIQIEWLGGSVKSN